jgi:carboxyl-terminal processing protease
VLLAVAKYYAPSGKAIQDTSVTPSVAVADSEVPEPASDEAGAEPKPRTEPEPKSEDLILKKALEVLQTGTVAAQNQPGPSAAPQGDRIGPLGVPRRQ